MSALLWQFWPHLMAAGAAILGLLKYRASIIKSERAKQTAKETAARARHRRRDRRRHCRARAGRQPEGAQDMAKALILAALIALAGCQTPRGTFCAISSPIRISSEAVDALSDQEVAAMKRFLFAIEEKIANAILRMTEGMAGDRQFFLVVVLGNLVYAALPLIGIIVLAIAWLLI
jgi:outer membrane murein-binding lipoprotein Lpp